MADRPPPRMGPGRRVVYRPDHSQAGGIGGLLRSKQIRQVVGVAARNVAAHAARLTDRSDGPGPHLADNYKIDYDAGLVKVSGNLRVNVEVYNDLPHAGIEEFGNETRAGKRMLGRAGSIVGEYHPGAEGKTSQNGKDR